MSSRELILFEIRESNKTVANHGFYSGKTEKPKHPHARPKFEGSPMDELLRRMAAVQMTVEHIDNLNWVPGAVVRYLEERDIDISETAMDIAPELQTLDWIDSPLLHFGAARPESHFAVTSCIAAVAETGSIMMASSAAHPVTLTFLPDCHIVVLRESTIVAYLEDAWELVREYQELPRAINLNTGPSRTADIEQAIEIGAHGPRAMHVLLVKDL